MKHLKTYEASQAKSEILGEMLINRIIENNIDAAIKLINDKDIDINYKDAHGYSPILVAAMKDRLKIVKLLIKKGANVNDQEYRGQTPLMGVANYTFENLKLLELLIDAGADWNIVDNDGYDFMYRLSTENYNNIVEKYPEKYKQYLIKKEANKYNL
jgi:ankyrin repeat protein